METALPPSFRGINKVSTLVTVGFPDCRRILAYCYPSFNASWEYPKYACSCGGKGMNSEDHFWGLQWEGRCNRNDHTLFQSLKWIKVMLICFRSSCTQERLHLLGILVVLRIPTWFSTVDSRTVMSHLDRVGSNSKWVSEAYKIIDCWQNVIKGLGISAKDLNNI